MKALRLLLLLSIFAHGEERTDAFYDPTIGFSAALLPLLTSFEKASVITNLRGFIARGDTFPGFRASDREPTKEGLYLNVVVSEDVEKFSDRREQKAGITHRLIQVPAPVKGWQSLLIELDYGTGVSARTLQILDTCIEAIKNWKPEAGK